jgi:hypothetical protein
MKKKGGILVHKIVCRRFAVPWMIAAWRILDFLVILSRGSEEG